MEKDKVVNRLRSYFKNRRTVSVEDIRQYFRRDRPKLDEEALKQKITELEQAGILQRSHTGQFTFREELAFRPVAEAHYNELTHYLNDQYEGLYCFTATQWVNEISTQNRPERAVIVEVDASKLAEAYRAMRELGVGEVYRLDDSQKKKDLKIDWAGEPAVLKPLVEGAPVQQVDEVWVPTLEKLLVDLYCDPELFPGIEHREMISIFDNAFHLYQIDYDRLQAYAKKRRQLDQLESFLRSTINPAFSRVAGEG